MGRLGDIQSYWCFNRDRTEDVERECRDARKEIEDNYGGAVHRLWAEILDYIHVLRNLGYVSAFKARDDVMPGWTVATWAYRSVNKNEKGHV